jgi:hypothetical protein
MAMVSRFGNEMNRSMTEDQFCQVVDAILKGKYSWACVLILRFAGYNPLHYIPYRTYNRLTKENECHPRRGNQRQNDREDSLAVDNLPHMRNLKKDSRRLEGSIGHYEMFNSSIAYEFALEYQDFKPDLLACEGQHTINQCFCQLGIQSYPA